MNKGQSYKLPANKTLHRNMINPGEHIVESYAHIINANSSLLQLNPTIEKFGYRFVWVDATELERNFSDILSIPKNDQRLLTITIGKEYKGISHQLHNAILHSPVFDHFFMHMEFPRHSFIEKNRRFYP